MCVPDVRVHVLCICLCVCSEFLDMMANHDLGTNQTGLANLVVANTSKITATYRNAFSGVLAERNQIKHKKQEGTGETCFPHPSTLLCRLHASTDREPILTCWHLRCP